MVLAMAMVFKIPNNGYCLNHRQHHPDLGFEPHGITFDIGTLDAAHHHVLPHLPRTAAEQYEQALKREDKISTQMYLCTYVTLYLCTFVPLYICTYGPIRYLCT